MRRLPVTVALAVLLTAPASLRAQLAPSGDDRLRASRLEPGTEVSVDGVLDETFWDIADAMTGFLQREPEEGDAATERTEVRVAYDDEILYVGVWAFDSEPDRIVSRILQRDRLFANDPFGQGGLVAQGDDAVALLLDPFHDHRNGVVFATNPNGAEFEALLADEGGSINIDWRGVWEVASQRTPQGWTAEFAIPWRTLRYQDAAGEAEWGINVLRVIRRRSEETLWRSSEREGGGLHRVSRAGHLVGLTDLPRPGLNVETKPFLLGGRRQEVDGVGSLQGSGELSTGVDLKTEVRPGLLLDLTVNTDFAQVEVDDAQVNLTRFSLFFPEKRDFFLENSGIFDFGVAGNPLEPPPYQMFFSRRIGISEDGAVPILAGARLTGRLGGQTVGLLNVVTGEAEGIGRESFSVARVKRDVGQSNYLGAMVVDRRGHDPANTTAGVDGQFVIRDAWVWDFFGARSRTADGAGDGSAYYVGYNYQGNDLGSFFSHFGVTADTEAGAGFITRTDLRRTDLYVGPTWRPEALGLRDVTLMVGGSYAGTMSDNRLQDWSAGFFVAPTWLSSDNIGLFVNASETVVDEGFDLSDDVSVPVGRYQNDHLGWFASSSSARMLSVSSSGMISRFYDGSLVRVGGVLTAAPSSRVTLSTGVTHNAVEVPSGAFTADILSFRFGYSFSTRAFANALVQYNSLDDDFSTNVRFQFIHRPGSDLFVVFTEDRGVDDRLWDVSDRGLVMKLTYLLRM